MKVSITQWDLQPLEEGEEPGMPTYRVQGTVDGNSFCCDISCEIDGRDCEFEHVSGFRLDPCSDEAMHVFDTLCENESWLADFNKQAAEYYG